MTDPVHHGDGMSKYTSYRVQCMIQDGSTIVAGADGNVPMGGEPNTNNGSNNNFVLRRYSDFVWLYDRLQKERAGSIVPPLPEKQSGSSRFSPDFIEERRVGLERFLRRVWIHPECRDAPSLFLFVEAENDLSFHAARSSKGHATDLMIHSTTDSTLHMPTSVPKQHGMKKWIAKAKTSVKGDLVQSPNDELFVEMECYIESLDKQIKAVLQHATTLIKRSRQTSVGLANLGSALMQINSNEATVEEGHLMGCEQLGHTAEQQSSLTLQYANDEVKHWEEPLKEYVLYIQSLKVALQKRADMRIHYTTWLHSIDKKQKTLPKLRSTPGSEAKAFGMETSLQRKQSEAETIKEEYEVVCQRLLREFDRFKRDQVILIQQTFINYTQMQIQHHRQVEQNWSHLLPQLTNPPQQPQPTNVPLSTPTAPPMNHHQTFVNHDPNNHHNNNNNNNIIMPNNNNNMMNVGAIQYRDTQANATYLNGM